MGTESSRLILILFSFVKISLEIFNAIINACPANLLTFYALYVVNSLQNIFKQEKVLSATITPVSNPQLWNQLLELKLTATETVIC